jgi:hypothetical protein
MRQGMMGGSQNRYRGRREDQPRIHEFITNYTKRREIFIALITRIRDKLHEREDGRQRGFSPAIYDLRFTIYALIGTLTSLLSHQGRGKNIVFIFVFLACNLLLVACN